MPASRGCDDERPRKIGGRHYRRLTNVEYARAQGFPDNHCDAVRYGKQYILYGNAVPPAMAEWVLRRTLAMNDLVTSRSTERREPQLSLVV